MRIGSLPAAGQGGSVEIHGETERRFERLGAVRQKNDPVRNERKGQDDGKEAPRRDASAGTVCAINLTSLMSERD